MKKNCPHHCERCHDLKICCGKRCVQCIRLRQEISRIGLQAYNEKYHENFTFEQIASLGV